MNIWKFHVLLEMNDGIPFNLAHLSLIFWPHEKLTFFLHNQKSTFPPKQQPVSYFVHIPF